MPDVVKLKKKAADFELKKQFDKALAIYVEILDGYDASDQEVDVSLFNRVGDLYLKQGSVGDAVDYYEQAVDRYADGGFHNNAIALCNKILRNSPGRASVYYKLGKISAHKGFKSDAKKNFLEYADRMQASGKIDEAFRALKEFADLCPDQDDIRLMLAEQLSKQGRGDEAIEQLQLLYVRYSHEGRSAEARATVERMKAIDPGAEPRELGDAPRHASAGLVFLDLNDQAPARAKLAKRATQGLNIIETGEVDTMRPPAAGVVDPHATPLVSPAIPVPIQASPERLADILETPVMEPAVLDGLTRSDEFERNSGALSTGGLLDGLESTSFEAAPAAEANDLLDFEPTSFASAPSPTPSADVSGTDELLDLDVSPAEPREDSSDVIDFGEIDLGGELPNVADNAPAQGRSPSLMGLPMLEDDEELVVVGDGQLADDRDDGESIGGDLQLIMPDGTPVSGTQTVEDVPFMDLDLPHAGEAVGDFSRNSVELEAIELDLPPADELPLELLDDSAADTPELDAGIGAAEEPDVDFDAMRTPAPVRRQSTVMAAQDVGLLQALSEADPDDHALRRRLAEAMLESGDRDGGLRELETAMVGFERNDDLVAASKLADEIVLLNPASVRHHQKRVEYAFRTDDRSQLIEAYLQLADALFRAGQMDKSRAIYQRVIDLSPEDLRAQAALESFPDEPIAELPVAPSSRPTVGIPRASTPAAARPSAPVATPDDEYINLGDWLRDDEAPKDTRMVVAEQEPTGDEEADFQDMLKKFKQGISENVEEEDHQSHYDLGVAFKEMGLLDEAISEFQKALRAPANRVPTYEALGLCFIEKEQYPMAATILGRALHEPAMSESQLIGVLYLLGRCAQERGQRDAAIEFYQRVFVVDIQFQDVGERLAAVEGAAT